MATSTSQTIHSLVVTDLEVRLGRFQLGKISFRIDPGRITGFLGHNGAGKTTTLRSIMGMVRKDGGTIRIEDLDHLGDEKRFKQRLGFVPEECFFYARMSIRKLLSFVAGFHPSWDEEYCRHLLDVLSLDATKKVGELSKGMRMKVNLVAAMSYRPDILILDEPTSGLDPRSRSAVLELLDKAAHEEGRAVFFSTHNLHEVERIADHLLILDDGKILLDEALDSLRRREQADDAWSVESFFLELTE